MIAPPARTVYITAGRAEMVCLEFHAADGADTGVIICPPFGFDEVSSYRSRREWARRLSADGYPTVRLTLPGTGNSGGQPGDPGRVPAWTAAVAATADWLRRTVPVSRVVAIGIGLGGLVSYRAIADGAAVDDLVLWATPSRGRGLVRQLRAFSRMETSEFFAGLPDPPPLPDGELEAGGFRMSVETIGQLTEIDLATLPLPGPTTRRVLLLGQDGIAFDERLHEALSGEGVAVVTGDGQGYQAMTGHPQRSQTPHAVIAQVTSWLRQAADGCAAPAPVATGPRVQESDAALVTVGDGDQVRERPFTLVRATGQLVGTLTEPLHDRDPGLCAVLLNAGGIYRVGPNRMWVEAARRWAARGVPTLRLDVEAIGDSDGQPAPYGEDGSLYVPELVSQVLEVLEALHDRGVGERFVLGGLCSGAYWAFHGALADDRVQAAMMLNPRAFVWDVAMSEVAAASDLRTLRTGDLSWAKIRKNASLGRVVRVVKSLLANRRRASAIDELLARFESSGKRALLLFSEDEPLHADLVLSGRLDRLRRCETLTFEQIAVRDHTLRPTWSQQQAHAALDRALERELDRAASAAPGQRVRA